ncbi:MAG TPA: hypothetical protein VK968_17715 [Roseimicrobium sp.]|nr:hypothetical protein [Roseimicrobium sp.]
MKLWMTLGLLTAGLTGALIAADVKPVYQNDFEKADVDSVPADFLVIDGAFAVKSEEGKKFMELPGAPLETYGFLFGPTEKDGIAVTSKLFGTKKGRSFPLLGVGLNGVGGYRLYVAPAKKAVELKKGDDIVATVPYEWKSGTWSFLKLQNVAVAGGGWKVQGKVWEEGTPEPAAWTISFDDKTEAPAGRPSLWGCPFAGTPIRFDDIVVTPAVK